MCRVSACAPEVADGADIRSRPDDCTVVADAGVLRADFVLYEFTLEASSIVYGTVIVDAPCPPLVFTALSPIITY